MMCGLEKQARKKAYYERNREWRISQMAAYDAVHRDEKIARNASFRAKNRDVLREKRARGHAEFTEWLQILRDVTGCEDEGPHSGRLEHHHVDPDTKRYRVSEMYTASLDLLEEELEKCVVLCVACHKKRHVEIRAEKCVS